MRIRDLLFPQPEAAMTDYSDTIRNFIERQMMGSKSATALSTSESLIEKGVIDSMGVQVLIGYLEKEFGIRIVDTEIVPENFETIKSVADFVSSKLSAGR